MELSFDYLLLLYFSWKDSEGLSEAERELKDLKEQLNDDFPVGPLIRKCCTMDQVIVWFAVLTNIFAVWLFSALSLQIGKSCHYLSRRNSGQEPSKHSSFACCSWPWKVGCSWSSNCWSCCCWVLYIFKTHSSFFSSTYPTLFELVHCWLRVNCLVRYSNIFVTAPSPENLKTLFEFVCKGFDMLEYKVCYTLPFVSSQAKVDESVNPHCLKHLILHNLVVANLTICLLKKKIVLKIILEVGFWLFE